MLRLVTCSVDNLFLEQTLIFPGVHLSIPALPVQEKKINLKLINAKLLEKLIRTSQLECEIN